MNSLKSAFTVFHPAALKRLLVVVLAVLLLGVLPTIPALASGSGTWTVTGSLNLERYEHTATLLQNGQVLVAGGQALVNNQYVVLASAELYNPSTGAWTTTGSMHTAREFHTATLLTNGQVLVAGGSSNTSALACAELYNPSTGTWTTTGSMSTVRDTHTATLLTNGQVLVAGGQYNAPDCVSDTFLTSAELYTP